MCSLRWAKRKPLFEPLSDAGNSLDRERVGNGQSIVRESIYVDQLDTWHSYGRFAAPGLRMGKARKKFKIVCQWCGERKRTADSKSRWCSDRCRTYGNRAVNAKIVPVRTVTD